MHILQSIYLLRLDAILFSKLTVPLFLVEDSLVSQSQLFTLVIYLICELFTFVLVMPFHLASSSSLRSICFPVVPAVFPIGLQFFRIVSFPFCFPSLLISPSLTTGGSWQTSLAMICNRVSIFYPKYIRPGI